MPKTQPCRACGAFDEGPYCTDCMDSRKMPTEEWNALDKAVEKAAGSQPKYRRKGA